MSETSFCPKGRSFSFLKDCICKQFLLYLWSVSWQQHNWAVIEISRCLLFIPQPTEKVSKTQTTPKFLTQFKATFRKDGSKAFFKGQHTGCHNGNRHRVIQSWQDSPTEKLKQHPSFGQQVCAFFWIQAGKEKMP